MPVKKKTDDFKKKKIFKKMHLKEYGKDYVKFLVLLCFILFVFKRPLLYPFILDLSSTEKTIAYVIDEKNYERRGHLTDKFTYSYKFRYENTDYYEDSNIRGLKIGDTLTVEFNTYIPSINRILNNNN